MSILKNSVDSIAIGLEDFTSPDQRRVISCTRNIFAGILLLFKYKLSLLSPPDSDEALIKQRVLPAIGDDSLIWKGKGKKTVDVQNIKERFQSLNIEVDWKRIDKVNNFRNDIEHYYSNLNHEAIRSLISDSFLIINDFIRTHIDKDPKELLGDKAWSVLIEVNEVYEREKAECNAAIEGLEYFSSEIINAFEEYSCDDCGSTLITPTNNDGEALSSNFVCKSCGKSLPYEDIVSSAVENYFSYEVYLSYTDGDESPITDCPECTGVYLYEEGICSSCGHSAEHECQSCHATIIPEELSTEPFCGYCAHVMSRDD